MSDSHPHHSNEGTPPHEIRLKIIGTIWGCATGMLGICIPLMAVVGGGAEAMFLPVAVIGGATVSTVTIWLTGQKSPAPQKLPPSVDPNRLKDMEERLFNLETMDRYERLAYEEKLNRLPGSVGSSMGDSMRSPAETIGAPTQPLKSGYE